MEKHNTEDLQQTEVAEEQETGQLGLQLKSY